MAHRDILQCRAISVANENIAEIDWQPSIEEGDAFDPTRPMRSTPLISIKAEKVNSTFTQA
jgi:hypothetical protein